MSVPPARRLSGWTMIVRAGREVGTLLFAGATGLLLGGLSTGLYVTMAGVVMSLLHNAVKWAAFSYTVYDDRIELRRALIGRSVTNIPIDRIRGVDISTTLPHRVLGVAVVHIDAAAAGENTGEGTLNAVSRAEAVRLRQVLLSRSHARPDGAPAAVHPPRRGVLYARALPRWYLYAPLSGAYILTPFALAGSLLGALYNLGDDLGLLTERRLERLGQNAAGLPPLLAVGVVVLLVLAMPVASVVAYALFNWDFTLRAVGGEGGDRDGTIVAERGLITRRSVSLEHARIRGVELRDNPLERLAGVVRLGALVTGLGDSEHRRRLLPTSPREVVTGVAGRVMSAPAGSLSVLARLTGHPASARRRRISRAVLPPLAVAPVALVMGWPFVAYGAGALALLCLPLALDRYRQLGHADDGTRLTMRSGSLRRHQVIIEHRAVLGWELRQSLFQRRSGLVTLVAGVGAGRGGYPVIDLAEEDAVALARDITPQWVTPFLE
ncbi:PH domain-containing protein [Actinomadura scrupuli]|uniref:PH domain-containing protein n=1 Tax=Actinomadura scrupuli TaxID=559629 RepID=UPI003D96FFEA